MRTHYRHLLTVIYNTFFEAVQSLKQGKIDAVLLDKAPANVFLSQNDDLKQAGEELGKEEYAIAVSYTHLRRPADHRKIGAAEYV